MHMYMPSRCFTHPRPMVRFQNLFIWGVSMFFAVLNLAVLKIPRNWYSTAPRQREAPSWHWCLLWRPSPYHLHQRPPSLYPLLLGLQSLYLLPQPVSPKNHGQLISRLPLMKTYPVRRSWPELLEIKAKWVLSLEDTSLNEQLFTIFHFSYSCT